MPLRWTPGIGDPSLMGWLTVLLYLLAALLCWLAARYADGSDGSIAERGLWRRRERGRDKRFWRCLVFGFAALAINKQLDLQSLLTEIVRSQALGHGWYDHRRFWQGAFVGTIALCGLAVALAGVIGLRRRAASVRFALVGVLFTLCFVMTRAASFHHIDHFLAARIGGWGMNWLLEWAGILTVAAAALSYAHASPSPRWMLRNWVARLRRPAHDNGSGAA